MENRILCNPMIGNFESAYKIISRKFPKGDFQILLVILGEVHFVIM